MAKNSIRDFSATAGSNTDIQSVNIDENCPASGINNAIRELMVDLKNVSTGAVNLETPAADSLTVAGDLTVDTNTLKVDSSNNRVGIGSASPEHKLSVFEDSSGNRTEIGIDNLDQRLVLGAFYQGGVGQYSTIQSTNSAESSGEALVLQPDGGNVGIGTSSPGYSLQIGDGTASENMRINSSGTALISITSGTSSQSRLEFGDSGDDDIGYIYYDNSNNSMQFATNTSERMRIDSSGNALVGTTSNEGVNGISLNPTTAPGIILNKSFSGTANGVRFWHNSSQVGSITYSNTATAYNTSSDYRQKENVADMTGAIDRVKALAPKRFNFIADADTTVDGFLAHEAQVVVPEAVTGTHNEVDDDGNAVMQGIDQSKLVPLLTGALQEAIAKIETLETEMTALKARVTALEA